MGVGEGRCPVLGMCLVLFYFVALVFQPPNVPSSGSSSPPCLVAPQEAHTFPQRPLCSYFSPLSCLKKEKKEKGGKGASWGLSSVL